MVAINKQVEFWFDGTWLTGKVIGSYPTSLRFTGSSRGYTVFSNGMQYTVAGRDIK